MATTTSKSPMSFASLPAELRNEIYYHTLLSPTPIQLPYAYQKTPFHEPGLLHTSAWIRAEAAPIYYGSNTFSAPSPLAAQTFLLGQTSEDVRLIKHFRPLDLALPLSADRRWLEALRTNLNKLAKKKGLKYEAIEVPVRDEEGGVEWWRLDEIEEIEVVFEEDGDWRIEWRDWADE